MFYIESLLKIYSHRPQKKYCKKNISHRDHREDTEITEFFLKFSVISAVFSRSVISLGNPLREKYHIKSKEIRCYCRSGVHHFLLYEMSEVREI